MFHVISDNKKRNLSVANTTERGIESRNAIIKHLIGYSDNVMFILKKQRRGEKSKNINENMLYCDVNWKLIIVIIKRITKI
jgi:hypothetical protein